MASLQESSEEATVDRSRIIEWVRRFGGSCSDAILDPLCSIFTVPGLDGLIGYRVESSCAIVYGDPLCDWEDVPRLVEAFAVFCRERGIRNIIYVIATEQFANWAMQNSCAASVEFGQELVLDPHDDPKAKTGVHASLVRRKVRHAQKEHVVVEEYIPENPGLERQLEEIGEAWLQGRKGLQIHISHVHLFDYRAGKRWFYAKQGDRLIGVIVLNHLQSKQGWLINHLMPIPGAAHGTPEILLSTVLETLAKEGCHYVTFGAVPTSQLGEMVGLGTLSQQVARFSFRLINSFFHLDGKMKFWEKFDPKSNPSYLLFTQTHIGLRDIWALMRALNVISSKNH
ncbi:conserved hypothetical protein [Candidatus Protochlamydia naegleriophila]|uniref:Phosphatidylglycerol lysyltransferase C-terminal domain-containing protein n=1 Tax=Candidatus Protochlamydia naegleriophila TaxID=389348 RepID=A0A0U5ERC1_9BACT|nr:phosphatidylglycerol lysyltransferase domain-containing protein [Candidatus Protochlamydia naegleriophila]CUI16739.1 conserved hypothetical protein [Candidatus Protochlamydia naegleriophila]